jgi:hypothetical protein
MLLMTGELDRVANQKFAEVAFPVEAPETTLKL